MQRFTHFSNVVVEDIVELTPRKDAEVVTVQINKPPRLEDVDVKINELVDILMVLEANIDGLEREYFADLEMEADVEEDIDSDVSAHSDDDPHWRQIRSEYAEEIQEKDKEYEEAIRKLTEVLPPTNSP